MRKMDSFRLFICLTLKIIHNTSAALMMCTMDRNIFCQAILEAKTVSLSPYPMSLWWRTGAVMPEEQS